MHVYYKYIIIVKKTPKKLQWRKLRHSQKIIILIENGKILSQPLIPSMIG